MSQLSIAVLLLPISFLLILLFFSADKKHAGNNGTWHGRLLITMVVFSAILVLLSEILSAISRVNATWLMTIWGALALVLIYVGWKRGWLRDGWRRFRDIFDRFHMLDWVLMISVVSILVLLIAVGIVAPANNVDVMQYHMPRVLQWIQNESLAHFPTAYDNQNTRPYFTELIVLNISLLSGSDRLANTVQLFGAVGTMITVAGIVSLLGGGRVAQWVAALFTFSLPMGLLQLTTPKDDVMAGFWIAALLFFVLLNKRRELEPLEFLAFGLSLGQGMLTKGTFLPFALPIMVWYFLPRLRPKQFGKLIGEGLLLLLLATVVNGAFWLRNIKTYGGPYGDRLPLVIPFIQDSQSKSTGSDRKAESLGGSTVEHLAINIASPMTQSGQHKPQWMVEEWGRSQTYLLSMGLQDSVVVRQCHKVAQMAAMNLMTPASAVNNGILKVLGWFPTVFPESYRGMLREAVWNYANTSGNPLHFLLTSLVMTLALIRVRKHEEKLLAQMSLVVLSGYGFISFSDCAAWTVCMRYQLPLFIFGGVLLGSFVSKIDGRIGASLAVLLFVYSFPYVFLNNMRPVIGMKPWPTRIDSVFSTPRDEILFAHIPNFRDEYAWVAEQITASQCDQVGLFLKAYEFEYPFWWLLEAPQSGIKLQHIHSTPETEMFQDPDFVPCAVICTVCGGEQEVAGLSLVSDFGSVQYYSSIQPNPRLY